MKRKFFPEPVLTTEAGENVRLRIGEFVEAWIAASTAAFWVTSLAPVSTEVAAAPFSHR